MTDMRFSRHETNVMLTLISPDYARSLSLKVLITLLLLLSLCLGDALTFTLNADVPSILNTQNLRIKRNAKPFFISFLRKPRFKFPFRGRRPSSYKPHHGEVHTVTHHSTSNDFHPSPPDHSEEHPWAHEFPTKEEFDFSAPSWFKDGEDHGKPGPHHSGPESHVHFNIEDFGPLKSEYVLHGGNSNNPRKPKRVKPDPPSSYHNQENHHLEHPKDPEGYHENFLSDDSHSGFQHHSNVHPSTNEANRPFNHPGLQFVNFHSSFNPGEPSDGYTLDVPPAHAAEVTRHNIYRGDYPVKDVKNEKDKITDDLVPSGVKGLDPLTMSFIKSMVRQYGKS